MSAEVVQVLTDARALLVEDGWCQKVTKDATGRHCAAGAVVTAGGYDRDDYSAVLHLYVAGATPSVSQWNDAPGRTVDEVLALFDRAIETAGAA